MQSASQNVTINKPTPRFLQAGCPSYRPTNSVKALKGILYKDYHYNMQTNKKTKYRSLFLGTADRGVVNCTLEHTALLGVVSVPDGNVVGVE